MEGRESSLQEVMAFREEKAFHQAWMQQEKPGCVIISLGMNIPGPRKTAPPVRMAFFAGGRRLPEECRRAVKSDGPVFY